MERFCLDFGQFLSGSFYIRKKLLTSPKMIKTSFKFQQFGPVKISKVEVEWVNAEIQILEDFLHSDFKIQILAFHCSTKFKWVSKIRNLDCGWTEMIASLGYFVSKTKFYIIINETPKSGCLKFGKRWNWDSSLSGFCCPDVF